MSEHQVEEVDEELREMVLQQLETSGVLSKVRSQLRASVFHALEQREEGVTPENSALTSFLSSAEGRQLFSLVREFLQHFQLNFTLSVLEPEAGVSQSSFLSRGQLAASLKVDENSDTEKMPLLAQVARHASANFNRVEGIKPQVLQQEGLTEQQIADAKVKFSKYDVDNSGAIDRNELSQLFSDLFPSVNPAMLDRYCTSEFQAADKDLSAQIEFDEFLHVYRRFFVFAKGNQAEQKSALNPVQAFPRQPTHVHDKLAAALGLDAPTADADPYQEDDFEASEVSDQLTNHSTDDVDDISVSLADAAPQKGDLVEDLLK